MTYALKHLGTYALFVVLLLPSVAGAEIPHLINMQSMIFDEDGNVTASESVDLSIKILDGDGNVVFSEEHPDVPVVKGAVNVSIGEPSGGVPLDILDPSNGTKVLDVVVDGTNPFELMPLGAVPYAMWAERAETVKDDSIESRHIKDGTIKVEDLDPLEFTDIGGIASEGQLPGSVATDAELSGHTNSGAAHLASAIVVSGSFVTFVADDVQEAIEKLDGKLAEEIVNRQSGQTTAVTNITNLQNTTSDINNIPGTLTNKTLESPTISGGTVTSDVTVNDGVTVDGVDLSQLAAIVTNKKTITGSQDIFTGNSAHVWVYQGRAGAPVRLFLVGGLFDQAHYSEMPSHTHTQVAHNHGGTGSVDLTHDHEGSTGNAPLSGTTNGAETHSHTLTAGNTVVHDDDWTHRHQILTEASNEYRVEISGDGAGGFGGRAYRDVGTQNGNTYPYISNFEHNYIAGNDTNGDGQTDNYGSTDSGGSHSHSFSIGPHNHSITTALGSHSHSISSVAPDIDATGTPTAGVPLSTVQKTYLSGMQIFIDGANVTAALLALADALNPAPEDWSAFGDGTVFSALNDLDITDPGTGYMDVSSLFSSVGFHIIELRQSWTAGGKISWVIQVD